MKVVLLWLELFWAFTRISMLTWGGGPSSLPLMKAETVERGFVSDQEFVDALAMGNTLPGPIAPKLGIYIGYKVTNERHGPGAALVGGMMGMLGSVLPSSLVMLIAGLFFISLKDRPEVQSMLKALRPVVVGMLIWTAYDLGVTVLAGRDQGPLDALRANADKFAIVVAAFIALTWLRVHPAVLVLVAAVFGLVVYR